EVAVADRLVDARQLLVDDVSRAHVHVPDFVVAHLPLGQTDGEPRGVDERVRELAIERVERGRLRQPDGVAVFFGTLAKTIQNHQYGSFYGHVTACDRARRARC